VFGLNRYTSWGDTMPLCCRHCDGTRRVVWLALGISRLFRPVVTMLPLRRQRNTRRSATVHRGIVTTGQIVLGLSWSVAFKNLFSLFVVYIWVRDYHVAIILIPEALSKSGQGSFSN
jgi:hypothetical protein